MQERELIRQQGARISGYATRWTASLGDFDGRGWTLNVLDVPSDQQREVQRRLWVLRALLQRLRGVVLTFVFVGGR